MIFEFDIPIAIYLPKAKNNIKTLIINHLNNFLSLWHNPFCPILTQSTQFGIKTLYLGLLINDKLKARKN
jgi:hypothetical protein